MSKPVKIILGIFFSLVVISAIVVLLLRGLLTKSFPDVDGNIIAPGLEKPVKVLRDAYGVPHILAQNEHDLFFAQGYVHAQDRLWQMDLERRAALGRLSEVFGSATLKYDRLFRTVGLARIADSIEASLHPESRRILQAYADGVNCFIGSHRGKFPIEFDMLNFQPEAWTVRHSLALMRLAAWELNLAWYVDLTLGCLAKKKPIRFFRRILKMLRSSCRKNGQRERCRQLLSTSGGWRENFERSMVSPARTLEAMRGSSAPSAL